MKITHMIIICIIRKKNVIKLRNYIYNFRNICYIKDNNC